MNYSKKVQDSLWRDITSFGGLPVQVALIVILLSIQEYSVSIVAGLGIIILTGIVILIRTFYFKNRPNKETYNSFLSRIDASSFPSLHSARSVFLASLFIRISPTIISQISIGICATLIIYSRIYLKKHDWVDVIAGALLGFIVFVVFLFL